MNWMASATGIAAKRRWKKEAKQLQSDIRFSDVAGNEPAIAAMETVVQYLRKPKSFEALGAHMPSGILFYGPPGTGKTLMARALAGEAGVPFLHANGADFVQMYVGVGASRIRSLFRKARSLGRAVIFIDEIDSLGRSRSPKGDNGERDQTLGALLGEMSGFRGRTGLLVVGATNRREMLDEALLRPGRFDRHVFIGLPDVEARGKILSLLAQRHPLEDFDAMRWARKTLGFSGAALEAMLNEAALLAAQEGAITVREENLDKAWRVTLCGEEISSLQGRDKKRVAYHEAGHAMISRLLIPEDAIDHVTILPHSRGSGGHTLRVPEERMLTRRDLYAQIQMLLGGRAAEEMVYGEEGVTSGAAGDIEKATKLLEEILFRWGMDDGIGPVCVPVDNNLLSTRMGTLYTDTMELLAEHAPSLRRVAASLCERETLSGDELQRLLAS